MRSFYGRERDGGVVEKFDLIATIYHRVMVRNGTERVEGNGLGEEGALVVSSEEGEKKGKEDEFIPGPWERIFSEIVLEGLSLKSKGVKTVVNVTLPGRIM